MNWKYHEFTERPLSDSCWSVQTGPDGRIYIACCTEHTGGETATVVRLDETNDTSYAANTRPNLTAVFAMEDSRVPAVQIESLSEKVFDEIAKQSKSK